MKVRAIKKTSCVEAQSLLFNFILRRSVLRHRDSIRFASIVCLYERFVTRWTGLQRLSSALTRFSFDRFYSAADDRASISSTHQCRNFLLKMIADRDAVTSRRHWQQAIDSWKLTKRSSSSLVNIYFNKVRLCLSFSKTALMHACTLTAQKSSSRFSALALQCRFAIVADDGNQRRAVGR